MRNTGFYQHALNLPGYFHPLYASTPFAQATLAVLGVRRLAQFVSNTLS